MRPYYREPGLIGAIRTFVRRIADLVHAYRSMPNVCELPDGSVWVRVSDGYGSPITRMRLPEQNPFMSNAEGRESRADTAFTLMGDDVFGYMIFMLRRDEDGDPDIDFRYQSQMKWTPAFTCGFAKILDTVEGVFS